MKGMKVNLILYNGQGITMEPGSENVTAIAIQADRIAAVGCDREILAMKVPETELIDLQGKTFLPGLIKTHAHPMIMGQDLMELNCGGNCTSIAEMVERVAAAAKDTPKGEWIIGKGWDEALLKEKRPPCKADFDRAVPDHPILLYRICRHIGMANQNALDRAGINAQTRMVAGNGQVKLDPQTGEPTGILVGPAVEMLPIPKKDRAFLRESYRLVEENFISKGITTSADMTVFPDSMRLYQQLRHQENLRMRLRLWIPGRTAFGFTGRLDEFCSLGVESGIGDHWVNFQGLKFYIDGSLGGRTALMINGYPGEPERQGESYCDQKTLNREIHQASIHGLRTAVHAIGDQAIEMILKAHEALPKEVDIRSLRSRIEHCAVPTPEQVDRIAGLGLCVGSSIGFLYSLATGYQGNLFPEQVASVFPQNTYHEKGIPTAANSDAPVCDPNPMLGIYSAVCRLGKGGESFGTKERVSVRQALKCYTLDAAYLHGDEEILGSLQPGKYADLAVLDRDPCQVPEEEIPAIKNMMTIVNGKVSFVRRGEGLEG